MDANALWFVAPRAVEIRQTDVGEPAEGDLVVRTEWSGISAGTELLAYRGEIDPETPLDQTLGALGGTFRYPFRYGYSCVGIVERGDGQTREGNRVFAFHPHQDRFVVPARDVRRVDGDPRIATLLPLVETALQVTLDASPRLEDLVVVTGMGVVGLLTAILLRRSGASVLGVEPREARRACAAKLDVESVPPEGAAERVGQLSAGAGADVVVEASGRPEALADSLAWLAHEGTALVCSWYGTEPVPLPLGAAFHRRRLSIRSTQVSTLPSRLLGWTRERRLDVATRLLSELPLEVLATHAYAFGSAADAFDALDRGDPGVLHVALEFG